MKVWVLGGRSVGLKAPINLPIKKVTLAFMCHQAGKPGGHGVVNWLLAIFQTREGGGWMMTGVMRWREVDGAERLLDRKLQDFVTDQP